MIPGGCVLNRNGRGREIAAEGRGAVEALARSAQLSGAGYLKFRQWRVSSKRGEIRLGVFDGPLRLLPGEMLAGGFQRCAGELDLGDARLSGKFGDRLFALFGEFQHLFPQTEFFVG